MFKLTFTEAQLQIISQALVEAPFKRVAELINDINNQIAEQQKVVTIKEEDLVSFKKVQVN